VIAALATAALLAGADPPDDQAGRIGPAFEAAEALQGPLDGEWRIRDRAGRTLYVLSLSDPGEAPAPLARDPAHPGVEGAWRNPGRSRAAGAGVIDTVTTKGASVLIAFSDGQAEAVTLRRVARARWTGTLVRAGRRLAVAMTRF
jgi:hypothetical protein